jgi:hypothetical protein
VPTSPPPSVEARRTAVARALAAVVTPAPESEPEPAAAVPAPARIEVPPESPAAIVREIRIELGRLSEHASSTDERLARIEAALGRIETSLDRVERARPQPPRRDRGRLRTLPEVPSPDVALSAVLGDDAPERP